MLRSEQSSRSESSVNPKGAGADDDQSWTCLRSFGQCQRFDTGQPELLQAECSNPDAQWSGITIIVGTGMSLSVVEGQNRTHWNCRCRHWHVDERSMTVSSRLHPFLLA